jgi:hypothetical protein
MGLITSESYINRAVGRHKAYNPRSTKIWQKTILIIPGKLLAREVLCGSLISAASPHLVVRKRNLYVSTTMTKVTSEIRARHHMILDIILR